MGGNVKLSIHANSVGEHTPGPVPHLHEAHEHTTHGEVIGNDPSSLGARQGMCVNTLRKNGGNVKP